MLSIQTRLPFCGFPAASSGRSSLSQVNRTVILFGGIMHPIGFRGTAEQRFWKKVDRRGDGDCWNWRAATSSGYGRLALISPDSKYVYAHRFSWELHNGSIPIGMFACHRCDNPSCVNPSHLFLGTAAQNMADMIKKGRAVHESTSVPKGEANPRSKLKERDVLLIRRLLKSGESQIAISSRFGVSKGCIGCIKSRKNWSHL